MPLSRFNEHMSQHYVGKGRPEDSNDSSDLNSLVFEDGAVDFGNRRVTNIAPPTTHSCAVSMEFMEDKIKKAVRQANTVKLSSDAKGQRVRNVKDAEEPLDAINKKQLMEILEELKTEVLQLSNKQLDAKSMRIINVKDAEEERDAVPLQQLVTAMLDYNRHVPYIADTEDDYNIKNKRLMNVGAPVHANDAATKGYVDSLIKNEILKLRTALKKPHV